ncbi:hypothetical protein Pla52o_37160 [Novipirellula galeiformis]|uniref:Uncharacterized protein n=1 Tax=Novipirellula galeiformis TaxID=2528004 RepID=A0A5C6CFK6_9BACT|nr:transmembrane 9 family protein [Novipirellula galeiformis]TWU21529.1 hypothetical protein Pla52o_37160 [Novipirellula galeiformis]
MPSDKPSSAQPVVPSRMLPRVSFRLVFAITTLSAIVAALARQAGDGGALATAVMTALLVPAICFALFAMLFLFAWAITSLWFQGDDQDTLHGSPFAAGQLPPQIMPPREHNA